MWWHGVLSGEFVDQSLPIEHVENLRRLKAPDDLFRVLEAYAVSLDESVCGYEKPCALINFHSSVDEEHGVGFLTDGNRILGIGYSSDPSPYETSTG